MIPEIVRYVAPRTGPSNDGVTYIINDSKLRGHANGRGRQSTPDTKGAFGVGHRLQFSCYSTINLWHLLVSGNLTPSSTQTTKSLRFPIVLLIAGKQGGARVESTGDGKHASWIGNRRIRLLSPTVTDTNFGGKTRKIWQPRASGAGRPRGGPCLH